MRHFSVSREVPEPCGSRSVLLPTRTMSHDDDDDLNEDSALRARPDRVSRNWSANAESE